MRSKKTYNKSRQKKNQPTQQICTMILKALKLICLISWKIEGEENIPKKPCLIVANHHGPWESLFLQTLLI